jgi:ABC-2 type transport system ATP-binding protein
MICLLGMKILNSTLLYAVPGDIREKRIAEVLNLVGLTERKDDQVKKYSGGMRRHWK